MLLCLSCVSCVIFLHTIFISLSGFATFPENGIRMDNEIEIILHQECCLFYTVNLEYKRICIITYSNMTSSFRFPSKRAIYVDGKIVLAHARCTHLSHVIKSQNKIIYTVVNVLYIYIH